MPDLPTSSVVTLRFSGERSATSSSITVKPGIERPARVRTGPAETPLLELPAHREPLLDSGRDVLPRGALQGLARRGLKGR